LEKHADRVIDSSQKAEKDIIEGNLLALLAMDASSEDLSQGLTPFAHLCKINEDMILDKYLGQI
jgi:hypothetical protein